MFTQEQQLSPAFNAALEPWHFVQILSLLHPETFQTLL